MVLAVEFSQGIEEAWARVATFVPKLIGFLLILLVGWIIARIVRRAVDALLERVGFDRAVERGGIKRALSRTKYDASDFLATLVYYAILLLTLQLAFGVFGPNPISDLIHGIIAYLPKVFAAVLILVVAAAIAAVVRELVDAALGSLSYGTTLANLAGGVIIALGVFAALDQLEIAPAIVNGLFYALLAILVGVTVVAVGGGGVRPMQQRWERTLARYDEEKERVSSATDGASDRVEQRAEERKRQADPDHPAPPPGSSGGATTGGTSTDPVV